MTGALIYLIAGEASGDALGAGLIQALKEVRPDLRFAGIGGEAMQKQGLTSLFSYRDLSLMGFVEIVPHMPKLLRRLKETVKDIARKKPDVLVTIDSPGFNFLLAKRLKNNPSTASIRRVHYVAPSVWAYKPGRARKTARLFDALLALLPFEPPYFEKEGLPTTFIGHPVLWEDHAGDKVAFRTRHRIAANAEILLLLPGSRMGEVKRHLSLFLQAAKALPGFTPVILAGAQVQHYIRSAVPAELRVCDVSEKKDAFASAALALSKSGTITLELASAMVPMVVAHRVSPGSAWLLRRLIRLAYVSLVNIAANKPVVPELLQENCTLPQITQALQALATPQAREIQRREFTPALALLKGKSDMTPSLLAAREILHQLEAAK